MNSRTLGILSAVAVAIILAAFWIGHARSPQNAEQKALYPDLKGKLSTIGGISIFKAGDQIAVEMARDGAQWKVKQKHDYPADTAKVNALLIGLEGATVREEKTSNAANYSALSVQDLTDAASTGVRVELNGAAAPIKLIIGKRDQAAHATYVRRAGEAQSWLIGVDLEVAADAAQWLKRDIVNIGADRIQEATVEMAGQPSYASFKKSRADANFDVRGIPKGRELNSVAVANVVAQALTSLQLDDVRPQNELANEKGTGHAVFRTFDGLVVDCTGYAQGEHRWITLKFSYDADLAKKFRVATASPDTASPEKTATGSSAAGKDVTAKPEAAPKDAPNPAAVAAAADKKGQEEVAALSGVTSAWAYAIPTYKFDSIFKPVEDLLKKPEMLKKPDMQKKPDLLNK